MAGTSFLSRLWRGLRRHPTASVGSVFLAYSVLWTLTEPVVALIPSTGDYGSYKLAGFLLCAVLIGLGRMAVPSSVRVKIPGSNTVVTVEVGDILSFDGHKIIAVNEYFDSQLGDHVSPNSLHGQCILRLFNGDRHRFEQEVDACLPREYTEVERTTGRRRRYRIGTTAVVSHGEHRLFLPALSRTDIHTLKASANVQDLMSSLHEVWRAVRLYANGDPVAVPLMGSGLAGVNLPYLGILELTMLSIVSETKNGEIAKDIRVILTKEVFAQVDLSELIREWSY